jgi:hypothetical protein
VFIGGPGLTSAGLKSVVDFMYTGTLRIEPATVWDVLAAADILLLAETRKAILESYLTKQGRMLRSLFSSTFKKETDYSFSEAVLSFLIIFFY